MSSPEGDRAMSNTSTEEENEAVPSPPPSSSSLSSSASSPSSQVSLLPPPPRHGLEAKGGEEQEAEAEKEEQQPYDDDDDAELSRLSLPSSLLSSAASLAVAAEGEDDLTAEDSDQERGGRLHDWAELAALSSDEKEGKGGAPHQRKKHHNKDTKQSSNSEITTESSSSSSYSAKTDKEEDDDSSSDDDEPYNNKKRRKHRKKKKKKKEKLGERMLRLLKANAFFICFVAVLVLLLVICGATVWKHFEWDAWFSLCVTLLTFCLLIKNVCDPALAMMLSTTLVLAAQIITPKDAIAGFSNTGVITIAVLFVVAAAVANTGSLQLLAKYVLRQPDNMLVAQVRLLVPVACLSAFINNTPLVAMMIPIVENWCRTARLPPSKLLLPLSYASIIGGTATIIGTSTNLIVVGLAEKYDKTLVFPFFEIGLIGVPIIVVGLLYMFVATPFLLPNRKSAFLDFCTKPRRYIITAMVTDGSSVIGKTIEEAGLRHLEGLFLVELHRNGVVIPAADPDTHLFAGDYLLFAGDVTKLKNLWKVKGLKLTGQESDIILPLPNRIIIEATISPRSTLTQTRIKKSNFRERFNAAILSVYRDGEPIIGKIGSITPKGGDVFLMVAKPSFVYKQGRADGDFLLVTPVGDSTLSHDWKKMIAAPVFAMTMIALNAADVIDLLTGSLCTAFACIFIGCLTWRQIKDSINVPVIVTIAASFAMADALEVTGVAAELADNLLSLTSWAGDYGLLVGVYLATALLTALLSNASAAAILVPIVFSLDQDGVDIKALVYCIMVAASADFSTPIGYQTNLMVWGPGGYHFTDYTRFGLPLQVMLCFLSTAILYLLFA